MPNDNFRDRLSCSPVGANITTTYEIYLKKITITASAAATISDIQSTLRTLRFSTSGMLAGDRKVRIWVIPKNYFFVDSRNGRVYLMAGSYRPAPSGGLLTGVVPWLTPATYVANEPTTWGLKVYSASIVSQREQDVMNLVQNITGYDSWVGGKYLAADDGWIWADGPDVGIKFFLKDTVSRPGSGVNGSVYQNFNPGEPNGDYVGGGLHILRFADNRWNDVNSSISSWIWEMGGLPTDANIITVKVLVNNPINQAFPF